MDWAGSIALIFNFFVVGVIIFGAIWFQYMKRKKHYDALVKALELGKNPDEVKELFGTEKVPRVKNGKGLVKSGIVTIGIGVGLALMGVFLPAEALGGMMASAAFVSMLGLSLVLAYTLTKKKEKE
ncbi:MAG: hypothetical protein JSV53_00700 [candidate division WOR-3 bacterium]|nr:MAG: hypothetical protein JSV53_00700 [candidate division WOR-3 bacterium]